MFREWIQNHPPVQVPSLNIPESLVWILTNRGLWITVHHCVKRKKTSMICVANLHSGISRIRLTRFEQRWNEDESLSVQRETVASMMRVKPALLEKQQWQQRRQLQSYVNTSEDKVQLQKRKGSFRVDRIRTIIPRWQTWKRHFFETFIFKYVYFDTMIDVTVKKWEQRIGMLHFQYWERVSVQNLKIN